MSTNFAKEFKLYESLFQPNRQPKIKHKADKLTEAVSTTYMAAYDKLSKKFPKAVQEANTIWANVLIDFGENEGYYNTVIAAKIKEAAAKNINSGMSDVGIYTLCATGIKKIDNIFNAYLEEESNKFDEYFEDLYYENFICYNDGHFEHINLLDDTFTGNVEDIECIVGVDYASGANICWIRGEDPIEDLEGILNI